MTGIFPFNRNKFSYAEFLGGDHEAADTANVAPAAKLSGPANKIFDEETKRRKRKLLHSGKNNLPRVLC